VCAEPEVEANSALNGTRDRWIYRVVLVLLGALAWHRRFVQDDAFISFRYARNWVEGHGLVFNPDEKVEGYTNFLWTVLCAVPIKLGFDVVLFTHIVGVALFIGSLFVAGRLAQRLTARPEAGIWTAIVLGGSFTFSSYATGGLETQLQAFLVLLALELGLVAAESVENHTKHVLIWSVVTGLAGLTRMDSALLLLPIGLYLLWRGFKSKRIATVGLAAVLPACGILVPWLMWKWSFYGDVLPNTYHLKVGSETSVVRGLWFVMEYFMVSWHAVALVVIAAGWKGLTRYRRAEVWVLVATLVGWCLYVVKVGGGFMEFRLLVAVIPLVAILFVGAVLPLASGRLRAGAMVAMLVGGFVHQKQFAFDQKLKVETVKMLDWHLDSFFEDWSGIGVALGAWFDEDADVTIALTAAGAVPYASGLDAIDMLGLTDAWVAKNGVNLGDRPGHQRIATLEYLVSRQVNLIVGHPTLMDEQTALAWDSGQSFEALVDSLWKWFAIPYENVPNHTMFVAIPIGKDRWLGAIYLQPNDRIDALIHEEGWPHWYLSTEEDDADVMEAQARPLLFHGLHDRSRLLGLSEIAFNWGEYAQAKALLDEVVSDWGPENDPESVHLNTWGSFWLGRVAVAMGESDDAKGYFQDALQYREHNFAAMVALAWVYIRDEDCETAMPILEKALAIAPEDGPALLGVKECS